MIAATRPDTTKQPTIRELVGILGQRRGVEVAILLGRDGLVIESSAATGLDPDYIAAHVPALVATAEALGAPSARGELVSTVVEYSSGAAVITGLNAQTLLVVLVRGDSAVGPLLFELRRHRGHMASIV